MPNDFDFFYDLGSPYSYLASTQLAGIEIGQHRGEQLKEGIAERRAALLAWLVASAIWRVEAMTWSASRASSIASCLKTSTSFAITPTSSLRSMSGTATPRSPRASACIVWWSR